MAQTISFGQPPVRRPALHQRGFTLVEVMVVVLILGILLAVGIPTFLGARERAQDRSAQTSLRNGLAAATSVATDSADFTNADAPGLSAAEPGLTFVASPVPSNDDLELSVAVDASRTAWGAAVMSDSQTCFYIRYDLAGRTTYGVSESEPCTGQAALSATASSWASGLPLGATGLDNGFSTELAAVNSWNTHGAGQVMDGWEVLSGNVDGNHNNRGGFNIPTPGQFIDLNGTTNGHIRRTVSVTPNQDYVLTMDVAENTAGGPSVKQFEVIWNGVVIDTVDVDLPANTSQPFSFNLPGTSSNQGVLELRSLQGSAHGPLIANPVIS